MKNTKVLLEGFGFLLVFLCAPFVPGALGSHEVTSDVDVEGSQSQSIKNVSDDTYQNYVNDPRFSSVQPPTTSASTSWGAGLVLPDEGAGTGADIDWGSASTLEVKVRTPNINTSDGTIYFVASATVDSNLFLQTAIGHHSWTQTGKWILTAWKSYGGSWTQYVATIDASSKDVVTMKLYYQSGAWRFYYKNEETSHTYSSIIHTYGKSTFENKAQWPITLESYTSTESYFDNEYEIAEVFDIKVDGNRATSELFYGWTGSGGCAPQSVGYYIGGGADKPSWISAVSTETTGSAKWIYGDWNNAGVEITKCDQKIISSKIINQYTECNDPSCLSPTYETRLDVFSDYGYPILGFAGWNQISSGYIKIRAELWVNTATYMTGNPDEIYTNTGYYSSGNHGKSFYFSSMIQQGKNYHMRVTITLNIGGSYYNGCISWEHAIGTAPS